MAKHAFEFRYVLNCSQNALLSSSGNLSVNILRKTVEKQTKPSEQRDALNEDAHSSWLMI